MPAIGITGGIATGKSTFSSALLRHLPGEFFDADRCARELLKCDVGVRESVQRAFDSGVLGESHPLERERLRALVFADEQKRRQLEGILHPVIRSRWAAQAAASFGGEGWFFADIPLLFETEAENCFDHVVVVACSVATQWARLRGDRGLDDEMAAKIIGAQLDLGMKMSKADYLIWNDSTAATLDGQASLLAATLRQRHG